MNIQKVNDWLIQYGAKGDLLPTIFDMAEMWKLNATRFNGFNLVFWWVYILVSPIILMWTFFGLIEAAFRWRQGKPLRNPDGTRIFE